MLAITNVNQGIETALKQDKSEGAMAPLGPIVATPVLIGTYIYIYLKVLTRLKITLASCPTLSWSTNSSITRANICAEL